MKVLLATHSYGLNGAALLLLDLAKHWVQQKKWQVSALMSNDDFVIYSDTFTAMGISPIVTTSGQPNEYDFALVNTLLDIQLAVNLSNFMPVILWVHEGNTLMFNWNIELSSLVRGFAQCTRIVFQTTWQSERIFKSFIDHLPSERIHHVPSGVNIEGVLYKTSHKAANIPIKLITLGTVYPRKRQLDLVQAVNLLSAKYEIECYVIGDYGQANEWHSRIQNDLKNPDSPVKWIGAIRDREKINEMLINSDIACFPSGDESHPLALLEAGLCALPMVVSNLPPYGHIGWINGKNCLMHSVGEIEQLVSQIERLINDTGLRGRLGNNARTMVINKYSKKKFIDNMDKVIAPFEKKL